MTVLALRRRTHVERKVLALLRGEDETGSAALPNSTRPSWNKAPHAPAPPQVVYFADLRRMAQGEGLVVRPAGSPYLDPDELRLLSWLAEMQRVATINTLPNDLGFVVALARCAGMLDGLGLHLSALTLYGAQRRAQRA